MFGIERKAARNTWTAALIVLLLYCVYIIRETLIVFAVALLLTYLLYPLFNTLINVLPGRSRVPALALVYLILFGVLTVLVGTIGSQVAEEANTLAASVPNVMQRIRNHAAQAHPEPKPGEPAPVVAIQDAIIDKIEDQLAEHSGEILSAVPEYSLKVLSASRYLLLAIVVPIISFFLLKDGGMMREELIELFSAGRNRLLMEEILSDIHLLLLQYMRALFTLCLSVFAAFALVFSLMRIPYALLLATIAFLMEFVPLVGPISSAVIIMVVVTFTEYEHPLLVLLFLGGYRLFQDYVLSPNLMATGVELHPLMVIFGVFAGGEIGGVAGIFLSVPILAMARVFIRHIRKQRLIAPTSAPVEAET
jgi:predicted PurR-regulated permease PerM